MKIEQIISDAAVKAVKALYGIEAAPGTTVPQKTKKEFEGNLTLVVFPFLKASHKAPEATAQEIGEYLLANEPAVASFNVIKGFLNLVIAPSFWSQMLHHIDEEADFGTHKAAADAPLVMVEYSSPNTNKPLHLGHVRNNLLGYSLSEILKANGNRVVKTNIVNDRGIHICKSMLAWQKWGDGVTPEKAEAASPLMQEARAMLRKWEAGDPEVRSVWEMMNNWVYAGFDETYRRLGVDFDKIYYESQTYLEGKEKVLEGLEKGIMYRKEDGSVWADLTAEGLDHKLLLRSDGTSVYMTQDIGTAKLRFKDFPIDKMIYVVGNEQNYHFQVLSILLDKLGFKWGKDLVHFSYGMVELPEGKMKSREGTVVDADDLMDEMIATARETSAELGKLDGCTAEEAEEISRIVGLGALKYFILKVDPRKNMTFNPKESIDFNGNTGPFIQYTHARICSVMRKAAEAGIDYRQVDTAKVDPSEKEISLIQHLADFPAVVAEAGRIYSPSLIANYVYDLVKEYNQFYHDYSILREENAEVRAFRLMLSANVAKNRYGIARYRSARPYVKNNC